MFRALSAYLGGKRRLAPLIFAELANVVPRSDWTGSVLLDPFSGGGAISLCAKAHGFSVVSGDLAERAVVVGRALIANSSIRLREADVLGLFRDPGGVPDSLGSIANILPEAQAQWFVRAAANAQQSADVVSQSNGCPGSS
jgi:hypothetical protein